MEFCKNEYQQAGITPKTVDTGFVLVTGETAKKWNAEEIVTRLSSESVKFVSAAVDPNHESLLGAMGSGIVEYSRDNKNCIFHMDIGGGSSKLALIAQGRVTSIGISNSLCNINCDYHDPTTNWLHRNSAMNFN